MRIVCLFSLFLLFDPSIGFCADELPLVNPEGCNYFLLIAADEPELSPIGLDRIEESDIDLPYRMEIKRIAGAPEDSIDSYEGLRAAMDAIKKYNGQRLRFVNFGEPNTRISIVDGAGNSINVGLSAKDITKLNRIVQNHHFDFKNASLRSRSQFDEHGNLTQKSLQLGASVEIEAFFPQDSSVPVLLSVDFWHVPFMFAKRLNSPLLLGIVQDGKIKELFLSRQGNFDYHEIPRELIPKTGDWSLVVYGF